MKKMKQLAALCCLTALCFSGCGQAKVPETIEESSVVVTDEGQITAYLVADFDKSYYDLTELTTMAEKEAAEFNEKRPAENAKAVAVEQVELLENAKVRLTYIFDNWETYSAFMGGQLFYGTVDEAAEKGYISGITIKSVKDGSVMSTEQLKQNGEKKLVITDAEAKVYCPGKVTYISEGAAVNEDGSVAAAEAEGPVYILMNRGRKSGRL